MKTCEEVCRYCINVAPHSFTLSRHCHMKHIHILLVFFFVFLFHIRLASQGQCIRSGAYSRSESILKVLAEELQSEICGAGAPLTSSLTPARVSQLFSGNIPDGVQNPPCPGGPENKRQQKRKTSKFYPTPHAAASADTSTRNVTGVNITHFKNGCVRYHDSFLW